MSVAIKSVASSSGVADGNACWNPNVSSFSLFVLERPFTVPKTSCVVSILIKRHAGLINADENSPIQDLALPVCEAGYEQPEHFIWFHLGNQLVKISSCLPTTFDPGCMTTNP